MRNIGNGNDHLEDGELPEAAPVVSPRERDVRGPSSRHFGAYVPSGAPGVREARGRDPRDSRDSRDSRDVRDVRDAREKYAGRDV